METDTLYTELLYVIITSCSLNFAVLLQIPVSRYIFFALLKYVFMVYAIITYL